MGRRHSHSNLEDVRKRVQLLTSEFVIVTDVARENRRVSGATRRREPGRA
ncbi:MAG: hypothetical protein ACYCZP_10305 [Acidimicrobiales bacterium]